MRRKKGQQHVTHALVHLPNMSGKDGISAQLNNHPKHLYLQLAGHLLSRPSGKIAHRHDSRCIQSPCKPKSAGYAADGSLRFRSTTFGAAVHKPIPAEAAPGTSDHAVETLPLGEPAAAHSREDASEIMTEKSVHARRLVVTGHDEQGLSLVSSDTKVGARKVPGAPGWTFLDLWGADGVADFPSDGGRPPVAGFLPPERGFRCYTTTIEPFTVAAHEQPSADNLEIAGLMDPDRPGMHRTATLDCLYVIEGSCFLHLDHGRVQLNAGDALVQNGTNHAWSNPFDQPCRTFIVMIGAFWQPAAAKAF
ncbi:cupin domain-containing protein [Sphingosinicella rhizophila]|uniref:Cupin domain-containing protein n=1 Tax=Sphingosinicella rhizophila TaxID=3050082 RepID=A0ABU3QAX9_9SPHN|nr:cupin domain-containing protein [Sphingosinicella sp. GR2756]MDT9600548.1 cupin domain-containing protein [Sphingosinicella sp. GR2756]